MAGAVLMTSDIHHALPSLCAGKEEADMRSEMRTNMDVDAGEEQRDDGLRVQVCGLKRGLRVQVCGLEWDQSVWSKEGGR